MWAGVSIERGGEILIGLNRSDGCIFNLNDYPGPTRYLQLATESTSLGCGLGGSSSVNLLIGMNIHTADDIPSTDEGLDFSIDLVLGGGKYIRSIPNYIDFINDFSRGWKSYVQAAGRGLGFAEKYGTLKSISENVVKNIPGLSASVGGKSALITIPVYGLGLRLSVNYKVSVTDVVQAGVL